MKNLLDFDDAGASDEEPAKGVTIGDIRAWHDAYAELENEAQRDYQALEAECGRLCSLNKRAAEFIRTADPFGDHFSERDLQQLTGEHAGPLSEQCPVCGGDCAGANPPVQNCPRLPIDDAEFGMRP